MIKQALREKIASTRVGNRLYADKFFRAALFSTGSLSWNVIYGLFNGILGIWYKSPNFAVMCAYYLVLGVMRLSVISLQSSRETKRTESSVMLHNGITMILLAMIMSISVAFTFLFPTGRAQNKIVMIAIATYTFVITGNAIRNVIKAHRSKSLFLVSLRNIAVAGAAGSMLSLQRSMNATFGGPGAQEFAKTSEGATGLGAFIIVLGIGISMIIQARLDDQPKPKS